MGSLTIPNSLPLIEFTKQTLKPGTNSWLSTSQDVRLALENYGCFVVVYDGIPVELHNAMFVAAEGLFDLSADIKAQNPLDERALGYNGPHPSAPLLESFGLEINLEATRKFTDNVWPNGNDVFCESAVSFSKQLVELYKVLMRMVFESYGVQQYCDSHIDSTTYRMGMIKYRPPRTNETNVGRASHTDKSIVNILDQNLVKGLQVQTKEGDWIAFHPKPSHFVVIAGDALVAWSNGRIHAPYHRVIISGDKPKYTIDLITYMRDMVQTPEELIDNDEHPLLFKPFSHYGYLQYCIEASKNKLPSSLKDYCGV